MVDTLSKGTVPAALGRRPNDQSVGVASWLLVVLAMAAPGRAADEAPATASAAPREPEMTVKDLAASYYRGDIHTDSRLLRIMPDGDYVIERAAPTGVIEESSGTVTIQENSALLWPRRSGIETALPEIASPMLPVPWGSRLYMIPKKGIVEFCSRINIGLEPRSDGPGRDYLRLGDWAKKVAGTPVLPEEWRPYILEAPVRGAVTELIDEKQAYINIGKNDGILAGMILIAHEHGEVEISEVRVESAQDDRCRIACQWKESLLAVGQKVTSNLRSE